MCPTSELTAQCSPDHGIGVEFRRASCGDEGGDCQAAHKDIHQYRGSLTLADQTIGYVQALLFSKASMEAESCNRMWEECREYDGHHLGTQLDKIENVLANEAFPWEEAELLTKAQQILFIDQVVLVPDMRGRKFGHTAIEMTIKKLNASPGAVVMLQAGSIGPDGSIEAGPKLERHWGLIGFRPWSYTDESWLFRLADNRGVTESREAETR